MRIPTVGEAIRFGVRQMEALAALPESVAALNRALASFAQTVAHLDVVVRRLDALSASLEGPITDLAPRLAALAPLMDPELLAGLPAVLDSVNRNGVPALESIGETQAQVAAMAASLDRLMHAVDDASHRLQELPGAGLVSRLRGSSSDAARERRTSQASGVSGVTGVTGVSGVSGVTGVSGVEETRGWSG